MKLTAIVTMRSSSAMNANIIGVVVTVCETDVSVQKRSLSMKTALVLQTHHQQDQQYHQCQVGATAEQVQDRKLIKIPAIHQVSNYGQDMH